MKALSGSPRRRSVLARTLVPATDSTPCNSERHARRRAARKKPSAVSYDPIRGVSRVTEASTEDPQTRREAASTLPDCEAPSPLLRHRRLTARGGAGANHRYDVSESVDDRSEIEMNERELKHCGNPQETAKRCGSRAPTRLRLASACCEFVTVPRSANPFGVRERYITFRSNDARPGGSE